MILIKGFLMLILCTVFPISLFMWLLAMIWMLTPFTPFKRLCHNLLDWHKPSGTYHHYPEGVHMKCKICGCDIVSDGAGGWRKVLIVEGQDE